MFNEGHPWGRYGEYEPLSPIGVEKWTEEGHTDEEVAAYYSVIGEFINLQVKKGHSVEELKETREFVRNYYAYVERKKGKF